MDNILDAEIAWKEFCWDVAGFGPAEQNSSRYIRINPDIMRNPPKLDAVDELKTLQEEARHWLKSPNILVQLEKVAHVLVASCFYYERTSAARNEVDGVYSCSGIMHEPRYKSTSTNISWKVIFVVDLKTIQITYASSESTSGTGSRRPTFSRLSKLRMKATQPK